MQFEFKEGIQELRKNSAKRNFDQSFELIINLKNFDARRESLNSVVILPKVSIKKKVCAFLENISSHENIDKIILKKELEQLTEKDLKILIPSYHFFIANAKLMPLVAKNFGKTLGIAGKMPDPKMGGVLMQEDEKEIKRVVEKLSKMVKIKTKQPTVKVVIGKESSQDDILIENCNAFVEDIIKMLPKREINLKNVLIKFTMSKPVKIKIK